MIHKIEKLINKLLLKTVIISKNVIISKTVVIIIKTKHTHSNIYLDNLGNELCVPYHKRKMCCLLICNCMLRLPLEQF